jgi:hypothetical protein
MSEVATLDNRDIHIMVDFETLSLKENAVLLSLGACAFDMDSGEIIEEFYAAIDPRLQPGRDIDASTVYWWLRQNEDARNALTASVAARDELDEDSDVSEDKLTDLMTAAAHPMQHVARAFIVWAEGYVHAGLAGVWSNGNVDHKWASSMAEYSGYKLPYGHWLERDYRTIKTLFPSIKADKTDVVQHNALADAIMQAKHLCVLIKEVRNGRQIAQN